MLYLCILLFAVFFAGVAMTIGEGLWSNTVSLIAIWLSTSLALALGPGIGVWAQTQLEKEPEFTWYFVFSGIWLVFFFAAVILRVLFDRLSRVRLRFIPQLEAVAGPLMGAGVALVFTSFCTLTLMIPIASGAWSGRDAAQWQKSTFEYLGTPMLTIAKGWSDGDHFGRIGS